MWEYPFIPARHSLPTFRSPALQGKTTIVAFSFLDKIPIEILLEENGVLSVFFQPLSNPWIIGPLSMWNACSKRFLALRPIPDDASEDEPEGHTG